MLVLAAANRVVLAANQCAATLHSSQNVVAAGGVLAGALQGAGISQPFTSRTTWTQNCFHSCLACAAVQHMFTHTRAVVTMPWMHITGVLTCLLLGA